VPTAYLSPSQLKELTDVSVNPGSGQNGYPLTWNNTTSKWEAAQPGKAVVFPASTSAGGSIQLKAGTDPSAPSLGELWFTGSVLKIKVNGEVKTIAFVGDILPAVDKTSLNFDLSTGFSTLTTRYF
jgi:hypothetical protein